MLSSAQFVRDMIHGHPQTCYELFRMDEETFFLTFMIILRDMKT